jgi:hypothetical protein
MDLQAGTILLAVRSFREQLRGQNVLICYHTLPSGSRILELSAMIKAIYDELSLVDALLVDTVWIRSEDNTEPDALSRYIDMNDWSIRPWAWKLISDHFPGLDVDRFASPENNQLPHYNTRWAHPDSTAYNALAQDWKGTFSYVCPPMAMVPQVLKLIREQRVQAVVIVPVWVASPWWPMLRKMAIRAVNLGNGFQAFQAGQSQKFPPGKNVHWMFRAVLVDGARPL